MGVNKATANLLELSKSRVGVVSQVINQLGVAVASKLVPLAAIFIYSRMMSVADYGMLNLFQSYLWIFTLALSLNLHVAVGRYIYQPGADFESFLGTTLIALGAVFALGTILILVLADATSVMLGIPEVLLPFMLVAVAGQLVESLMTQIAIYDHNGGLLLRIVVGKAVVSLSLSLALLLLWGGEKFMAVILADSIASVVLGAVVFILLRHRVKWTLQWGHLVYMSRYALPLVPYMLGLTVLSQFDRILIDHFQGAEVTGLYSLSYNFGVLLLLAITAILNALNPSFFKALNEGDYNRVCQDSRMVFTLALVGTLLIVLFGQQIASLILPSRYAEGFNLIPIVALGSLCFVVFQIWVRVLAYFHRTATISAITIVCAALNVGLNLWLIPLYGWQVAAGTTVVSYVCMGVACLVSLNANHLLPMILPWRELLWISLMLALVITTFQGPLPLVLSLGIVFSVVWFVRRDLLGLMRGAR